MSLGAFAPWPKPPPRGAWSYDQGRGSWSARWGRVPGRLVPAVRGLILLEATRISWTVRRWGETAPWFDAYTLEDAIHQADLAAADLLVDVG